MKKIFTLLFLISLSLSNLFAIVIYDPYMGIFDNSGSALCENLKFKYTLPDSLKTGYSFTVDITKNSDTRELSISYTFLPSRTSVFTTEIESKLTDYFLPIEEVTQESSNWNYLITVSVADKKTNVTKFFQPYALCTEIKSTCGEVQYVRKSLRYANECGPAGKGYVLYPLISKDSLIIITEMVAVAAVCVPTSFGVDSDVVVFKGLKNLNYKVFKKENSNIVFIPYMTSEDTLSPLATSVIIDPNPIKWYPVEFIYRFIGNADLSNCIGVGIENDKVKQFELYPNPVTNELNISEYIGQLKLTNQAGRQFLLDGNQSFDVSTLPKGLYIVNFELNGQVQQEKVIIK